MRSTVFCLLALLAAASVGDAKDLLQVGTDCATESVASLSLAGTGSGVATTTAFCQAEASAQQAILTVIEEYFFSVQSDAGAACTRDAASAVVSGLATATASAYTSVTSTVQIEGTGTACTEAFAGGDAFAISVLQIMIDISVQLAEEIFPGEGIEDSIPEAQSKTLASGQATGEAVAVIIADAWAVATNAACQEGTGFQDDFEVAFSESISTAVATLWANVVVEVCSNFEDADTDGLAEWQAETSMSTSEISGQIDTTNQTISGFTEGGFAGGEGSEVPPCEGDVNARCCNPAAKKAKTCRCGPGCTATEITSEEGATGIKTWAVGGAKCFCPP